jgi:hypothetical protein
LRATAGRRQRHVRAPGQDGGIGFGLSLLGGSISCSATASRGRANCLLVPELRDPRVCHTVQSHDLPWRRVGLHYCPVCGSVVSDRRSTYPRPVAQARAGRFARHGRRALGPSPQAALSDLANVTQESRSTNGLDGLRRVLKSYVAYYHSWRRSFQYCSGRAVQRHAF